MPITPPVFSTQSSSSSSNEELQTSATNLQFEDVEDMAPISSDSSRISLTVPRTPSPTVPHNSSASDFEFTFQGMQEISDEESQPQSTFIIVNGRSSSHSPPIHPPNNSPHSEETPGIFSRAQTITPDINRQELGLFRRNSHRSEGNKASQDASHLQLLSHVLERITSYAQTEEQQNQGLSLTMVNDQDMGFSDEDISEENRQTSFYSPPHIFSQEVLEEGHVPDVLAAISDALKEEQPLEEQLQGLHLQHEAPQEEQQEKDCVLLFQLPQDPP